MNRQKPLRKQKTYERKTKVGDLLQYSKLHIEANNKKNKCIKKISGMFNDLANPDACSPRF